MFKSVRMRNEPRRVTFKKETSSVLPTNCPFHPLAGVCSLTVLKHTVSALLGEDHRGFSTPHKVIAHELGADSLKARLP